MGEELGQVLHHRDRREGPGQVGREGVDGQVRCENPPEESKDDGEPVSDEEARAAKVKEERSKAKMLRMIKDRVRGSEADDAPAEKVRLATSVKVRAC